MPNSTMKSAELTAKPHYLILDGLRGVAAVMVVWLHIFEAHSTSPLDQIINHGYLAVDFFFVLSGYVIGYAYDDRWHKLSITDFFKRRLVRLHPMVIMGMIVGAIGFYFQGGATWALINSIPLWKMLLVMLIGFTMFPLPPSMDIRGWYESYPLNGPAWTLFYEYIANILYAVVIRKFSKTALAILVFIAGCALIHLAATRGKGDLIGGWSLEPEQLRVGFTRLMYPFFAGLLLSRVAKLSYIKNAFLWCSLLIIIVLSIPRIGGTVHLWMNGLYEALIIIFIFPLVVYLGASGDVKGKYANRVCKFLGDISYPIYITHYPLIYIYTAWVRDNKVSLQEGWPFGLLVFISAISIAFVCLKFYDVPIRSWLKKKILVNEG